MTTFDELRKDGMDGTIVLYNKGWNNIDGLLCDYYKSHKSVGEGECHKCASLKCPSRKKLGVTV